MKKRRVLLPLSIGLLLVACSNASISSSLTSGIESIFSSNNDESSHVSSSSSDIDKSSSEYKSSLSSYNSSKSSYSSYSSTAPLSVDSKPSSTSISNSTPSSNITDLSLPGISYDDTNKVFKITSAGEFVFTGSFEGNILVEALDADDVKIVLNEFSIASSKDSPIKCNSANELQVSLKKGTKNYIYDNREHREEADETQGNGAITSSCDLKISGKGSLTIEANYFNGIHSKDDLKIKPEVDNGSKIQIRSYNNCLKGNDSVEIVSGNLVLISTDGNGVMTESTDISSKGNQRGDIIITGGHIDIYCSRDGLDAAHDVNISQGIDALEAPILNIYTHKYSEYSNIGSKNEEESTFMYIKSNSYSSNYYFAVEFKDANNNITWVKANRVNSSGGSRSYYFNLDRPKGATNLKICYFSNSVTTMSESSAYAKMNSFQSINSSLNMASISLSGTNLSFNSWSSYSQNSGGPGGGGWGGPGGMQEGNSDKSEYSAKGIKAHNNILISDGIFNIKAYDDALHASYGDVFENGKSGEGIVTISGGKFSLYAADDALHADNELNIQGGEIDITNSYEGIEANTVNISGGYAKVYATDDGVNAASKVGKTPNINVSGGILDVTVYGNDIDGIDSNGNYTQTGGIVLTKGGTGGMSTGFDIDGTGRITGGTFIGMGPMENTLSSGTGITSYTLSGSWSAGNHVITLPDGTKLNTTTKYSYTSTKVWSDSQTKISIA